MTEDLDDADYAALADFRYALRRFAAFSQGAARAAGLTPQQHQALLAIRGAGDAGMLVGDLAERLLVKPHSASETVKRLAEQDLIARRPGDDDRREVRITLTPRARTILASLSTVHRDELRRLHPVLQRLLEMQ